MPEPPQDMTWAMYRKILPVETYEVALSLYQRTAEVLHDRRVDADPALRPKWWAFKRAGDFQLVAGAVEPQKPASIYIKLPGSPVRLGLASPYPHLQDEWLPEHRIWEFVVPTLADVPNVGTLIDEMLKHQPDSGPMPDVGGG